MVSIETTAARMFGIETPSMRQGRLSIDGSVTINLQKAQSLPAIKLDNLLKQLEGRYSAYKGTVLAEVKRNGSFLMLSGEDIGENIVLIPETQIRTWLTSIRSLERKGEVEFRLNRQNLEMIYER